MPKLRPLSTVALGDQKPAVTPRWEAGPRLTHLPQTPEKGFEDPQEARPGAVATAAFLTKLGVAKNSYCDPEAFGDFLRSETLKLVKGSYLLELHQNRQAVPPRQDLPESAFWEAEEALIRIRASMLKPTLNSQSGFLYVLSYRWLTSQHPDPGGFHLGVLAEVIKRLLQDRRRVQNQGSDDSKADIAIFWDYMCLPQSLPGCKRTPEEGEVFQKGLNAMNILYGHRASRLLVQPRVPQGTRGHGFADSGWCFFEASVGSIIKDPGDIVDVGLRKGTKDEDNGLTSTALEGPLLPDSFNAGLLTKKLTHQRDLGALEELYASSITTLLESTTELHFEEFNRDDVDLRALAESINSFTHCRVLNLSFGTKCSEAKRRSMADEQEASKKFSDAAPLGAALRLNTSILQLILRNQAIVDVKPIAAALRVNNVLQALDLKENNIKDITMLGQALEEQSSLQYLNLGYQSITTTEPLVRALRANRGLKKLHLSATRTTDGDCAIAAESLSANFFLQALFLRFNWISDSTFVVKLLSENLALTTLDLSGNQIKNCEPFAEALQSNRCLKDLLLSGNRISDVAPLGKSLNKNRTLRRLDLSYNQIVNITPVASALQWNSSLTELSLQRNKIVDVSRLAKALRVNYSMKKVDLRFNLIQYTAPLEALEEEVSGPLDLQVSDKNSNGSSWSLLIEIAPQSLPSFEDSKGVKSSCVVS